MVYNEGSRHWLPTSHSFSKMGNMDFHISVSPFGFFLEVWLSWEMHLAYQASVANAPMSSATWFMESEAPATRPWKSLYNSIILWFSRDEYMMIRSKGKDLIGHCDVFCLHFHDRNAAPVYYVMTGFI